MNYSQWVDIAKDAVYAIIKNNIVDFAVSRLPFLASGPFGLILNKLAATLARSIVDKGELAVFYKHADLRATREGRAFVEDAIKYRLELEGGDGETIKMAEMRLINSARTFIKL